MMGSSIFHGKVLEIGKRARHRYIEQTILRIDHIREILTHRQFYVQISNYNLTWCQIGHWIMNSEIEGSGNTSVSFLHFFQEYNNIT